MNLWERAVDYLAKKLIARFPNRVRTIGDEGIVYLTRFYIKHNGKLPGIYLHYFHRSDKDRDLHNHPWTWAVSFILTGGYYEVRFEDRPGTGEGIMNSINRTCYNRSAPGINFIRGNSFHRVILKDSEHGAWSIFISGPEVQDWGFMTGVYKYVPHQEYLVD
jgi:hypothetical protein